MQNDVIDVFKTLADWLKTHKCWGDVSFWDFSLALFLISAFCKIVFQNDEKGEK